MRQEQSQKWHRLVKSFDSSLAHMLTCSDIILRQVFATVPIRSVFVQNWETGFGAANLEPDSQLGQRIYKILLCDS